MNKIRVIDLLNKISKGEEVPKFKLKGHNAIWEYKYEFEQFLWGTLNLDVLHCLNSEIEVIEDEEPDLFEMIEDMKNKPKHIEEIEEIELLGQGDNWLETKTMKEHIDMELNPYIIKTISKNFEKLYDKQCELTKAVNYLLDKEEK